MIQASVAIEVQTAQDNCPSDPRRAAVDFRPLTQRDEQTLQLAPATVDQPFPFPVGMATAELAYVKAGPNTTDLTLKLSLAGGATVLTIPHGAAVALYGVTALYLSSVLGGRVEVVVAG